MSKTECSSEQLTFWKLGKQQVTADFSGGRVVSDAGLLAVRRMERGLGVLSELGRRLPDPRSQKFVTHDCERILVQGVYQILAGYFDYNDANDLRCDPLFQLLADVSPDDEQPLASGSTLARFQHAYTRSAHARSARHCSSAVRRMSSVFGWSTSTSWSCSSRRVAVRRSG